VSAPNHGSTGTLLGASTAAPAFDVPDDVAAGDIIVVAAFIDGTSTDVTGMPADFEHAEGSPLDVAAGGGFGEHVLAVMWKRATGTDSGTYDFTLSGSTFVYGDAARYEGAVGSGDPWDATDADESGVSSVSTAPAVSVATLGPDRLLIYVATDHNGDSGTWSPPAGFTQRAGGTNTTNVEISDLVQAAAGSSGGVSATHTVAGFMGAWIGALIGTTTGQASGSASTTGHAVTAAAAAKSTAAPAAGSARASTAATGKKISAAAAGPAAHAAAAASTVKQAAAAAIAAGRASTAATATGTAASGATTAVVRSSTTTSVRKQAAAVGAAAARAVVAATGSKTAIVLAGPAQRSTGVAVIRKQGAATAAPVARVSAVAVAARAAAGAAQASTRAVTAAAGAQPVGTISGEAHGPDAFLPGAVDYRPVSIGGTAGG
jgi:hypothetical protein